MLEVWKDIPGYEGLYQVSNFSRVKSLERIVNSRPGIKQKLTEKILNPTIKQTGYVNYHLSKNGIGKDCPAHRLVSEAFLPNPDNKPCINHKDGNKANCKLGNLEWCTYSENTRHAYKTKLFPDFQNLGEKNGRSKLTTEIVLTIRECFRQYAGMKQLFLCDMAEVFNTSRTTILRIVNQTHWRIEYAA